MPWPRFATEDLLPGPGDDVELRPVDVHREGRGGGVTEGEAPRGRRESSRHSAPRTPEVVPFQVKITSWSKFTWRQVWQVAIVSAEIANT